MCVHICMYINGTWKLRVKQKADRSGPFGCAASTETSGWLVLGSPNSRPKTVGRSVTLKVSASSGWRTGTSLPNSGLVFSCNLPRSTMPRLLDDRSSSGSKEEEVVAVFIPMCLSLFHRSPNSSAVTHKSFGDAAS